MVQGFEMRAVQFKLRHADVIMDQCTWLQINENCNKKVSLSWKYLSKRAFNVPDGNLTGHLKIRCLQPLCNIADRLSFWKWIAWSSDMLAGACHFPHQGCRLVKQWYDPEILSVTHFCLHRQINTKALQLNTTTNFTPRCWYYEDIYLFTETPLMLFPTFPLESNDWKPSMRIVLPH